METIERLQNWYKENCNSQWEHQYGVSIDTLDNPGWSIIIDLSETQLLSVPFKEIKIERSDEDWLVCRKADEKFEAFGGISNLGEILIVFLNWAERVED